MDQKIKNRLVGVIVMSALAVIFLPMVLDGSGVRKELLEVSIPPQPVVAPNPEFESKIIQLEKNVAALPDLEARFIDEASPPETEAVEPPPMAESRPAQQQATAPAPAAKSAPPAGGEGFVLQVGSYRDRDKALMQRDELRKSNIAAVFIEQFKLESGSSFRVRLGPFLNRDQALVARNKVKAKHNIDGIIMKYER